LARVATLAVKELLRVAGAKAGLPLKQFLPAAENASA
jgi:hypothetical protein